MSYLCCSGIQYSMGNEIVHYVMFGEREEMERLPGGMPVVRLKGDEELELRPLYLFWDKTDERVLDMCESKKLSEGNFLMKKMRAALVHYIQVKYKEVFLSSPETLFLSEKAKKAIPEMLLPQRGEYLRLHQLFARQEMCRICRENREGLAAFWVLPEEMPMDFLKEWLEKMESEGEGLSDLILFGDSWQKESGEEVLEEYYEETGLAGSFCMREDCKRMMSLNSSRILLIDCFGMSMQEIGRPSFYIDGAGVRTDREIHRLKGVCGDCQSLRNHLDRAFLSGV